MPDEIYSKIKNVRFFIKYFGSEKNITKNQIRASQHLRYKNSIASQNID